jgi:hypothetical protein
MAPEREIRKQTPMFIAQQSWQFRIGGQHCGVPIRLSC